MAGVSPAQPVGEVRRDAARQRVRAAEDRRRGDRQGGREQRRPHLPGQEPGAGRSGEQHRDEDAAQHRPYRPRRPHDSGAGRVGAPRRLGDQRRQYLGELPDEPVRRPGRDALRDVPAGRDVGERGEPGGQRGGAPDRPGVGGAARRQPGRGDPLGAAQHRRRGGAPGGADPAVRRGGTAELRHGAPHQPDQLPPRRVQRPPGAHGHRDQYQRGERDQPQHRAGGVRAEHARAGQLHQEPRRHDGQLGGPEQYRAERRTADGVRGDAARQRPAGRDQRAELPAGQAGGEQPAPDRRLRIERRQPARRRQQQCEHHLRPAGQQGLARARQRGRVGPAGVGGSFGSTHPVMLGPTGNPVRGCRGGGPRRPRRCGCRRAASRTPGPDAT